MQCVYRYLLLNLTPPPPQPKPGSCVSGCTKGLVCYWEPGSGNLLHELEEGYGSSVVKVGSGGRCILALFVEDLMRVWDELNGDVLYTLQLVGRAPDSIVIISYVMHVG